MTTTRTQFDRVLAFALKRRAFGFAVLEGDTLVDWGVTVVRHNKSAETIRKIKELVSQYQPSVVIFENHRDTPFRRSPRIRSLGDALARAVEASGFDTTTLSMKDVLEFFLGAEQGTKFALADNLAVRFPDELGYLLPPKRKTWMPEDERMAIFDAVALAVTLKQKRNG